MFHVVVLVNNCRMFKKLFRMDSEKESKKPQQVDIVVSGMPDKPKDLDDESFEASLLDLSANLQEASTPLRKKADLQEDSGKMSRCTIL